MSFMATAMACSQDPPDDEDDDSDCVTTRSYDYIGIKGGTNNVNTPAITSGSATALGAVIGHRASDLFSYELEYVSLGSYLNNGAWVHATAVTIGGIHTYQMTDNFGIFGRLGIAFTHTSTGLFSLGGNLLYPTVSLGAEYAFNKDISVRAAYDVFRLQLDPTTGKTSDALAGLTFLYKY